MRRVLGSIVAISVCIAYRGVGECATLGERKGEASVDAGESRRVFGRDSSGTCGPWCIWNYTQSTNTLVISGNGTMDNYQSSGEAPWFDIKASVKSIVINEGVTSVGSYAFYCAYYLTSVTFPSTVASIGYLSFDHCISLESVEFPSGVISIDRDAFSYCSKLETVIISSSVTSVGSRAFGCCNSLKEFVVDGDNPFYISVGGVLFNKTDPRGLALVQYPCGMSNEYNVPDGTAIIGSFSFRACQNVTSVSIPSGVELIEGYAFYECSDLESVTLPSSVMSIGIYAFYGCASLSSQILIPAGVTAIASSCFQNCRSLTSVTIPPTVTSIGSHSFNGCSSLLSITIPSSVTLLSSSIFKGCTSLKTAAILSSISSIPSSMFEGCTNLTSVTIPSTVVFVSNAAFSGCKSLSSLDFLTNVWSIRDDAFNGCSNLSSVTVPSTLSAIGNKVFNGCTSLKSVAILSKTVTIGNSTFEGCKSLESIEINGNISSIGVSAFSGCHHLSSLIYHGIVPPECSETVFEANRTKKFVIWIPIDYNSTQFCEEQVQSISSIPEDIRSQHNHCYEVLVSGDGETIVEERDNATLWKERKNGCIKYECDNKTGPVTENKCQSSEMCSVEGKCIKNDQFVDDKSWKVEIVIDGVSYEDFNVSEILLVLTDESEVDLSNINVAVEIDDYGQVKSIVLILDDEDTAKAVVDTANNFAQRRKYGIKSARVMTKQLSLSGAFSVVISKKAFTFSVLALLLSLLKFT